MKPRRVGEQDSGHRWQTRPTTTKRGSLAASAITTSFPGYRDRSRKRREPTSSNNRHGEQLEHRAGIRLCLGHMAENHMGNGKAGKSIFKAKKWREIRSLICKTLTCPDDEVEDKSIKERLVLKKGFHTSIGVHGITRAKCYTVKVVSDRLKRRVITAYPTLP